MRIMKKNIVFVGTILSLISLFTHAAVLKKELAEKMVVKAGECTVKNGKLYTIVVVNKTGDELAKHIYAHGTMAHGIINALNTARAANELQYQKASAENKRPKNLPEKIEGGFPIFLEGRHVGAIAMSQEQVTMEVRDRCLKAAIE